MSVGGSEVQQVYSLCLHLATDLGLPNQTHTHTNNSHNTSAHGKAPLVPPSMDAQQLQSALQQGATIRK